MFPRLFQWLLSVAVTSLPVLLNLYRAWTRGAAAPFLQSATGRGELMLIAAALPPAAIARLVASGGDQRAWKASAASCGLLICVAASVCYYADVANVGLTSQPMSDARVASASAFFFVCSVVGSGWCVALAEGS